MAQVAHSDLHEWADVAEKSVLVLNYTMTCPLACDFCCYGCHPKRTEKMPIEKAKDLISQASKLSAFSSVGFTGGEIFSYEDELLELSDHLAKVGLPFTVATAGHWGASESHARSIASYLVRNGLRRANISCDEAHEKFVPRSSVVNSASALAELGIPVYVVGTFSRPNITTDSFLPELRGKSGVKLISKKVATVGRAKKFRIDYGSQELHSRVLTCYRQMHHDIVIFWDGSAYPCCSTFNRSTSGLRIGNAFEEALETIWGRADSSSLFRVIKRVGFGRLYEIVFSYDKSIAAKLPSPESFAGACSLCNNIFSNPALAMAVKAIFAQYEADQLIDAALRARQLFGQDVAAHLPEVWSFGAAEMEESHGCTFEA